MVEKSRQKNYAGAEEDWLFPSKLTDREIINQKSGRRVVALLAVLALAGAIWVSKPPDTDSGSFEQRLHDEDGQRRAQVEERIRTGDLPDQLLDKKTELQTEVPSTPKIVTKSIETFNKIAANPDGMDIIEQVDQYQFSARNDVYVLNEEYGIEELHPGQGESQPQWQSIDPSELPVNIIEATSAQELIDGYYVDQNDNQYSGGFLIWTDYGSDEVLTYFVMTPSKEEANAYLENNV